MKPNTQYSDGRYVFINHNGVKTDVAIIGGIVHNVNGLAGGRTGKTVEQMLDDPRGKGKCSIHRKIFFQTNPHLDKSAIRAIFRLWIFYPRSFWIIAQAPMNYPLEWAFVVSAILAMAED